MSKTDMEWALSQLLTQIRDNVSGLSNKVEDLRKETRDEFSTVYNQLETLEKDLRSHPINCPINKGEVEKIIIEKLEQEKERPEKTKKKWASTLYIILAFIAIISFLLGLYDRYTMKDDTYKLEKRIEEIENLK